MSPQQGVTIAEDFTLLRKLGEGSSGIVYEASYDCCEDTIVALKFFPLPKSSIAFQKEIFFMENFKSSTNTVQLYDHFLWEDFGVIVMEKFSSDLLDFLNGNNTKKYGKKIFKQICLGVQNLHENNISHRDIKPENIFIKNVNCVKLGDFGSCVKTSGDILPTSGSFGTVWYNAPEVILNDVYNPKTADIWSLGIVLHIIFAGVWPFDAASDEILLNNLKQGTPNSHVFSELLPKDSSLISLLSSMLSEDPTFRPTIDEILKSDWLKSCKLKKNSNYPKKSKFAVPSLFKKITNFKSLIKKPNCRDVK